jgi:hypothetical protein
VVEIGGKKEDERERIEVRVGNREQEGGGRGKEW